MAAESIAPGGFFIVEDGRAEPVDRAAFLERAEEADYILVGEGHPIRCDHVAQAQVMRWLATARPIGPAVALEMVGLNRQTDLDAFNRGEINAGDLREVLDWERTWGHDYFAYGPVFAEAARHRLPLYAANLPPGAARAFGRGGAQALEPAHRQYLPETIIPAGDPQREELRQVFEAHAAMRESHSETNATAEGPDAQNAGVKPAETPPGPAEPASGGLPGETGEAETEDGADGDATSPPQFDAEAMFERFITVQSLWDTVMAESAVRVRRREGSPVVVLAGSGHVDNGWGIALRLAALDPEADVVLVAPWRRHPAEQPPPQGLGDVYFYCPMPPGSRMMGEPASRPEPETDGDDELVDAESAPNQSPGDGAEPR